MKSQPLKILLFILISMNLIHCKSIKISKTDKIAPTLSMGAYTQGLKKKAIVKSDEMPKKILVAEDEKVFWIASSSDKGGLKKLDIEVVSGGLLRNNNRLSQKVEKENDTTASGLSKVGILLAGELQFDSPTSKIILKSKASDWAGNITFTPTVSIERVPKPVARISASKIRIQRGESVQLNYETDHATKALLNTSLLTTLNGQRTVAPNTTTRYILKAENEVGIARDTLTIVVIQPPTAPQIASFTTSSSKVKKGQRVTLRWNTTNTTRIKIFKNNSQIHNVTSASGSKRITLNTLGIVNFKLEASNNSSTVSRNLSIEVAPDTNCFSYPYVGNFSVSLRDHTAVVYEYPPSNLYQGQRITSIKNPFNVDVLLNISGREQTIRAGQTTTFFNGLGVGGRWILLVPNPQPTFVKLKVCTRRN